MLHDALAFQGLFLTRAWLWWLLPPVVAVSLLLVGLALCATVVDGWARPVTVQPDTARRCQHEVTWERTRQRQLPMVVRCAVFGLAATAVGAGCTSSRSPAAATANTPTSIVSAPTSSTPVTSVDADETPDPAAIGAAPPAAAAGFAVSASPACRHGDPLADVYHPDRLHVVKSCLTVTGTVIVVRNEADGDTHVNLRLDPPDEALVNGWNVSGQAGALVAEIVPADRPGCTPGQPPRAATGSYDYGICTGADEVAPAAGTHVLVTGPYVLDADHGWMEIHPVWSIGPVGAASAGTPPATSVGSGPGVRITAAPTTVDAGATASLAALTSPGATCTLAVTLPSGAQSQSSGLGADTADAAGRLQWTWETGTRTTPGAATATVVCPSGSASVKFQFM